MVMSVLFGLGEAGKSAVWFVLPIVMLKVEYNFSVSNMYVLIWMSFIMVGNYYFSIRKYEKQLRMRYWKNER